MVRSVGPYEVIKRLAVGGVAEIYLARKGGLLGFEQHYALKILLPHFQEDQDHRKMMVDEARLTAQLDHPNIIKVHDLGEEDETLYMVMEYVNGMNLAQILARLNATGAKLPIDAAVFIAREMCAGLHYAHTRKSVDGSHLRLVHRDVSPQNVLVGFGGEIKLIDFGVAKAALGGRLETKTGIIKGKLTYMAPEYAVGSQQDHRSDVFAVGLCLYEMLTGHAAYDIEEPRELVEAVKHARIQRPSRFREEVDSSLEKILEAALEQKPDDRWATAQELQHALTGWLSTHAPDFTKDRLSATVAQLREAPAAPSAAGPRLTEQGLPATTDAPDLDALVATQALDLEAEGIRPRTSATQRKTTLGMPAGLDHADQGGPQSRAELLGLADLREISEHEDDAVEDLDVAATMAMEAGGPPPLVADDEPTPDPGVQVQREFADAVDADIANAPTGHLDVADIAPERATPTSELPTATDIDLNTIRGDIVQRVAQPNRPQILTQSGFQQFATRPRPPQRHTEPADVLQPSALLDIDPLAVTGPSSLSDGNMPLSAPMAGEMVVADQVDPNSPMSNATGERPVPLQAPVVLDEGSAHEGLPAVIIQEEPPPKPLEKKTPGLTPPEPDPDARQPKMAESATALINKFSERYDKFSKTESGRKTTDALIVGVLGVTLLLVLFYIFFFAD